MKTAKVLTCDNQAEAHIMQGRLENEGIVCFLTNENSTTILPQFNNMMGSGIQLVVREEDIEKARIILQDIIEPDNEDLICPNCGSTNIRLGMGKGKLMKLFNIFIAVFLIIPMGNLKPKYYCKDCKTEIR